MRDTSKRIVALFGTVATGTLLLSGTAFAHGPATANTPGTQQNGQQQNERHRPTDRRPAVVGVVTAVTGSTVTIDSRSPQSKAATTTYSVDAANATVYKNNATSSVSSIAVGDRVMVEGTVNGTTVTATVIRDGIPARGPGDQRPPFVRFQGNGDPVVGGSITAITGSTITITNKSNVTYTVDAAGASFTKAGATSSLSALAVGDNVLVQGTVTGTNIAATSVLDQGALPGRSDDGQKNGREHENHHGFFGSIGGFFHRLFGFF